MISKSSPIYADTLKKTHSITTRFNIIAQSWNEAATGLIPSNNDHRSYINDRDNLYNEGKTLNDIRGIVIKEVKALQAKFI
jgi:predicted DNA-binding ArsR family transcriptional regulator